jgi:hypothetical protein
MAEFVAVDLTAAVQPEGVAVVGLTPSAPTRAMAMPPSVGCSGAVGGVTVAEATPSVLAEPEELPPAHTIDAWSTPRKARMKPSIVVFASSAAFSVMG